MAPKLTIKQTSKFTIIWPYIRTLLILAAIGGFIYYIVSIPSVTTTDFAIMRQSLSNYGIRQRNTDEIKNKLYLGKTASETKQIEEELASERNKYVNENRARMFVESATADYYHGSYEEALRRLERARIYDPSNFSAFKLSGQIFFEKNKYRKAFNDWERAYSLPNDDKTIARDLDVLRKLLRYSRNEIEQLRQTVHRHPENKIAAARLKELEERVGE